MRNGQQATVLVLGAILFLAFILRVWGLNASLWYDEIATLTGFVRMPAADLFVTYGSLNNHVLYTWSAKLLTGLFGETAWALRFPAMAFGVASIWAVWRLLKEAKAPWVALATAALLAVSYHHVWFSQNARGYTGILLFTTLAGWQMARGLTSTEKSPWAYYALFATAALMTHLTAAFVLVAQGLTALGYGALVVFQRKEQTLWQWIQGPLIGFGGAIVAALLLFSPMLPDLIATFADYNAPTPAPADAAAAEANAPTGEVKEWRNPLWTIAEILRSFGAIGVIIPVAFGFAAAGAWRLSKQAPFIAIPYLIHIPLTLAILLIAEFRVWPRYFFIDIGFLLACGVAGAFWFAETFAHRTPQALRLGLDAAKLKVIGAIVMVAASVPLLLQNYAAPKQNFTGAKALVESQMASSDQVATVGPG